MLRHGFGAFLASRGETGETGEDDDPIEAIREGWDLHVRFGLENPNFYILIYGRARPGQPCGVVADVERMILATLRSAARQRRLRIAPEQAARQILAASTGVVLTLITDPADEVDLALSDQVRDAILDALATTPRRGASRPVPAPSPRRPSRWPPRSEEDPEVLSAGEASLMREWLRRLSATPSLR